MAPYRRLPRNAFASLRASSSTIDTTRAGTKRMEHFTDEHHLDSAQDIADVAAYISRLLATRSLGRCSGEYLLTRESSAVDPPAHRGISLPCPERACLCARIDRALQTCSPCL